MRHRGIDCCSISKRLLCVWYLLKNPWKSVFPFHPNRFFFLYFSCHRLFAAKLSNCEAFGPINPPTSSYHSRQNRMWRLISHGATPQNDHYASLPNHQRRAPDIGHVVAPSHWSPTVEHLVLPSQNDLTFVVCNFNHRQKRDLFCTRLDLHPIQCGRYHLMDWVTTSIDWRPHPMRSARYLIPYWSRSARLYRNTR